MIIMSVDYGDARTGLAVCDKFEMLASPVEVIHESYVPKIIDRIQILSSEIKPELIIVGLPKNMDGSTGERGNKCIDFAQSIKERCKIETMMWDERLTTVTAHKYLNDTNTRGKKRKNTVDAVAAVVILQSFIDSRK